MPYVLPVITTDRFHHSELDFSEFSAAAARSFDSMKETDIGRAYFLHEKYTLSFLRTACEVASRAVAIPEDVRRDAERYSRELTFSFSDLRSRVVRDRAHGSLDSSKLARLASPGLAAREFERLAGSAFKHRAHVAATQVRPRIAICADMNNDIRRKNRGYLPMLARLAYIISEAANIAGIEVALFGSRGCYDSQADNWRRNMALDCARPLHIPLTLKGWHGDISPAQFAIMCDNHAFISTVRAATATVNRDANGMESGSGAGSVEFARLQGAQIVVAFGSFPGDSAPDLLVKPDVSIEEAVRAIVAHMNGRSAA